MSFHPFAKLAAQAAVAAGEQGKFWEMHDALFANQTALKREDLLKYAGELKLDMARFTRDLDSEAVRKRVESDLAEGAKKGVQGTPTFFVNGKEYSGAKTLEQLQALVRSDAGRRIALTEITDSMMARGPAGAPVTVEFYADLESPVTPMASKVIEELVARYPSEVRVQFRNFPLSFHPEAPVTHCAAMTAAREGHFWEMAGFVMAHQESIREQDLIAYAGRLGMDVAKFAEAVQKRRYLPRVDFDVEEGQKRGLRGSPVVFVVARGDSKNEKRIDGVPSMDVLVEYVRAA